MHPPVDALEFYSGVRYYPGIEFRGIMWMLDGFEYLWNDIFFFFLRRPGQCQNSTNTVGVAKRYLYIMLNISAIYS
jgi:hypothetical protein